MNRRNVLKTLICVGASSVFPAAPSFGEMHAPTGMDTENIGTHTNPDGPRIGVIAVGGVGGTILSEFYGKVSGLHRSIAIDIDSGDLHRVKADQKILIDPKSSIGGDAHSRTQIGEAVAGLDLAFIVAGMGGVAGTSLSAQVVEVLQARQISSFAAAITPSHLTGPRYKEVARTGLQLLHQQTIAAFPIAHRGIVPIPTAVWRGRLVQPPVARTVEQLVRSVTSQMVDSSFGLDLDYLRWVLAGGGYAAIGYGSARGANAAVTATLQAIDYPLLGLDRLKNASSVQILVETSSANFSIKDVNKIFAPIRNTLVEFFDGRVGFGVVRTASMADDFRVTLLVSEILSKVNSLR